MLSNALLRILAPGSYYWFDRKADTALSGVVPRWQNALRLRPHGDDHPTKEQLLCDRYLAILAMSASLIAYMGLVFLIPVGVGLYLTFTDGSYDGLPSMSMKVALLFASALIGLGIPLSTKAMIAQHAWKKFGSWTTSAQAEYRPARWTQPGNIDLILAIPGFLFFVSIWWGR